MLLTNLSIAMLLISIAAWWWIERRREPGATGRSKPICGLLPVGWVPAGLVVTVFIAHLNVFDLSWGGKLTARTPSTHYHETFHYYLGTRYFAELGYTRLYRAVALADLEDNPSAYERSDRIRNLSTNQVIPRGRVLRSTKKIRAAFSDERWQAFKHDVAIHRDKIPPAQWRLAVMDHGYNATPVVTALLGGVANQPWIPTEHFLSYVGVLDITLIVLFGVWVGAREGAALALSFLFFTFANPLNDYSFIGASYLRYSYFLALAGALLALRRKGLAECGVLLACAGWMRIFPLAIYGFLLLRDIAQSGWRENLRANRRLHVSFAVTTFAILAGTSLLSTPDGRNPWIGFADNIVAHAGISGFNQIYLGTPLIYSPAREPLPAVPGQSSDAQMAGNPDLSKITDRTRYERKWPIRVVTIALLALSLAALRRASRTSIVIPSLLAIFCVVPMTSYYWAVLSLLPLLLPEDWRMHKALLLLFAALGLTSARELFPDQPSLRFALMSMEVLIFLVFFCLTLWRSDPRRASTCERADVHELG